MADKPPCVKPGCGIVLVITILLFEVRRTIGVDVYDLTAPVDSDSVHCSPFSEKGPIICFYTSVDDNNVHARVGHGVLARILPELGANVGLIDVGAGLGMHSILAASSGSDVLAVEALAGNVERFHAAVQKNGYENRITLLRNNVSGTRDLEPDSRNIHLDDLAPYCQFRKAVLRLDLGGMEHEAFRFSSKLFKAVNIRHIFMDWGPQRDQDVIGIHSMLQDLTERGYAPRSMTGQLLETRDWKAWIGHIFWQKM